MQRVGAKRYLSRRCPPGYASVPVPLFPFAMAICGHLGGSAIQSQKPGTDMAARLLLLATFADAKTALVDAYRTPFRA